MVEDSFHSAATDPSAGSWGRVLPLASPRLTARLTGTFPPGAAVSLYEAQIAMRGEHRLAELTLRALADQGVLDHPSPNVWVMTGAAVDPYRLAARVTTPYALAQRTALELHLRLGVAPSQMLISSPVVFASFTYAGVEYHHAGFWDDGRSYEFCHLPAKPPRTGGGGPAPAEASESVIVCSLKQTLMDCIHAGEPETIELLARAVETYESLRQVSLLAAVDSADATELTGWLRAIASPLVMPD
jgi:hypothetical protein